MIIGVNGKIGSGKDTVGQIIQYLTTYPENLRVNPVFNQGFEYSLDYSKNNEGFSFHNSDWEIKKFAGKLKQIASILTGATLEQLEDQDFKKREMGPEWGITYRELLQKVGTEAMRNVIHENVWVNALMVDYGKNIWDPTLNDFIEPNWVITDMRFPNEMDAVKAKGGITIRVNRTNRWNKPQDIEHASETALDNHKFDYVIDNNGSISDLVDKVKNILTLNNII
jgi:hypothetical protein